MSAEFYVRFDDPSYYDRRTAELVAALEGLPTFSSRSGDQIWLRGTEKGDEKRWLYDVRIFLREKFMLLEISAKPQSIEHDLTLFLSWLRQQTRIRVLDEDGEATIW